MDAYETIFPTLPGSVTRSIPGFEVKVFDEEGKEAEVDKIGKICIKRPLPPGSAIDIQGSTKDEALKGYFETVPEYFYVGDSGTIDENGYLKIVGRTEDIITLKDGETVTTAAIEDSINERDEVSECAVIAFASKERGDAPLAFVVLHRPAFDEETLALEKPEGELEEE